MKIGYSNYQKKLPQIYFTWCLNCTSIGTISNINEIIIYRLNFLIVPSTGVHNTIIVLNLVSNFEIDC